MGGQSKPTVLTARTDTELHRCQVAFRRREGPESSMRCATLVRRSSIASAIVGLSMKACQFSTGSWPQPADRDIAQVACHNQAQYFLEIHVWHPPDTPTLIGSIAKSSDVSLDAAALMLEGCLIGPTPKAFSEGVHRQVCAFCDFHVHVIPDPPPIASVIR